MLSVAALVLQDRVEWLWQRRYGQQSLKYLLYDSVESSPTPGIDCCCYITWLIITLLYFKGLHDRFEIQPGDASLFINGLRVDMSAYDPFRYVLNYWYKLIMIYIKENTVLNLIFAKM